MYCTMHDAKVKIHALLFYYKYYYTKLYADEEKGNTCTGCDIIRDLDPMLQLWLIAIFMCNFPIWYDGTVHMKVPVFRIVNPSITKIEIQEMDVYKIEPDSTKE